MPGGDGTGPGGIGPMTGRAAGYCAGYSAPGYMNPLGGRGFGAWGRGGGWGRRNWFYATGLTGWQRAGYGYPAWGGVPPAAAPAVPFWPAATSEQEIDMLKRQAEYLEDALATTRKRLEELEAKGQELEAKDAEPASS